MVAGVQAWEPWLVSFLVLGQFELQCCSFQRQLARRTLCAVYKLHNDSQSEGAILYLPLTMKGQVVRDSERGRSNRQILVFEEIDFSFVLDSETNASTVRSRHLPGITRSNVSTCTTRCRRQARR
jgi:hypothetical protein